MNNDNKREHRGGDVSHRRKDNLTHHNRRTRLGAFNAIAAVSALGVAGTGMAAVDIPSDLPVSPLFGALSFSQQMLRFEEFIVLPMPAPGAAETEGEFKPPADCDEGTGVSAMEALLQRRCGRTRPPRPTQPRQPLGSQDR